MEERVTFPVWEHKMATVKKITTGKMMQKLLTYKLYTNNMRQKSVQENCSPGYVIH